MSRQQSAAVLHAGMPLEQRFKKITDDRNRRQRGGERDPQGDCCTADCTAISPRLCKSGEHQRVERSGRNSKIDAFPCFAGTYFGRKPASPKRAPSKIRCGIGDPNHRHRCKHEPRRARLELDQCQPRTRQHDPSDDGKGDLRMRRPAQDDPRRRNEQPEQCRRAADRQHDDARKATLEAERTEEQNDSEQKHRANEQ